MKANDLRAGNLVKSKLLGTEHKVLGVYKNKIWTDLQESWSDIEDFEGVVITEERLLKFGFERQENNWKTLNLYFATISWERLAGIAFSFDKESIYLPHIQHIHQIQNFYFALTNQEL